MGFVKINAIEKWACHQQTGWHSIKRPKTLRRGDMQVHKGQAHTARPHPHVT